MEEEEETEEEEQKPGKENKRIPELATRDWQLSARANIHPRETREEIKESRGKATH